jgi:hypothetical protein
MSAQAQSQLLTRITLIEELKGLIISTPLPIISPSLPLLPPTTDEAQAIYAPKHPQLGPMHKPVYSVVINKVTKTSDIEYEARLIHYITTLRWELLINNPRICRSFVDAMEDLLECCYEKGKARIGMAEGQVFEDDGK